MSTIKLTGDLAISALSSLPIGVILVSVDGRIAYTNPKSEKIFGYEQGALQDRFIDELLPEEHRTKHRSLRENYLINPKDIAMNQGRILSGVDKNGNLLRLQIGLTVINKDCTLVSFIESTNKIIKPSFSNDPLTGLPNRNLFDEYSEEMRQNAIINNKNISIVFLDLDNFKAINDQFGHKVGDSLICEVADKLVNFTDTEDIVSRVGGDEFVICSSGIHESAYLQEKLDYLISQISSINQINGNLIDISASIGANITSNPKNIEISDMLKTADHLMYKAKEAGKGIAIVAKV